MLLVAAGRIPSTIAVINTSHAPPRVIVCPSTSGCEAPPVINNMLRRSGSSRKAMLHLRGAAKRAILSMTTRRIIHTVIKWNRSERMAAMIYANGSRAIAFQEKVSWVR